MALETLAVLIAPAALFELLALRAMAPPQLPDPSIHTIYIVDPHAFLERYRDALAPSARLRESARVGFLIPARLAYLLLGALPGFFAFRYLLALVAIGPSYLLARRLYGRWAGLLAIAVVMSSPVLITAWGTDFPDSAAVSYLTGGLAALGLSLLGERRWPWLIAAAVLLTLAAWSIGVAVPLIAAMLLAYLAVRLARERRGLWRDLGLLALIAALSTGVLMLCSKPLIGQFDIFSQTLRSVQVLSQPKALRQDHTRSWSWALHVPYLLVPPATLGAFALACGRRRRPARRVELFIGLAAALELAAFAWMQFGGSVQVLEMHFFSSTLWSSVELALALALAELARPLAGGAQAKAKSQPSLRGGLAGLSRSAVGLMTPAALVLVPPFAYAHAQPHPPALTWLPWGVALVGMTLAAALLGRLASSAGRHPSAGRNRGGGAVVPALLSACAVAAIAAAMLALSVTGPRALARGGDAWASESLPGTVGDPAPAYARALGGRAGLYLDAYRVTTELPQLVGPPSYQGEQLLMWRPRLQRQVLIEPTGIYHSLFNELPPTLPVLGRAGAAAITARRAAQILLLSTTGRKFARAVRALSRFGPVVVRRGVLRAGAYQLHFWLVDLRRYLRTGTPAHLLHGSDRPARQLGQPSGG